MDPSGIWILGKAVDEPMLHVGLRGLLRQFCPSGENRIRMMYGWLKKVWLLNPEP